MQIVCECVLVVVGGCRWPFADCSLLVVVGGGCLLLWCSVFVVGCVSFFCGLLLFVVV